MSLQLVSSFGVVTRQGNPTVGRRRFGVPPGGAFDAESWVFANAMAGCSVAEPAWELSMAQATFQAERSGVLGVAGAPAVIRYQGKELETGVAFSVQQGQQLVVEPPSRGARVYVSFGSGIKPAGWRQQVEQEPDSVVHRVRLRVVAGPQASMFDLAFLGSAFTVSQTGNRVGVRLDEKLPPHVIELPSEPQCVGTVQVSNDGTLILLGPDGPTIGGYPKIAVVATCDIGRLGQLRPGDQVRFTVISVEVARKEHEELMTRINRRIEMLRLAGL